MDQFCKLPHSTVTSEHSLRNGLLCGEKRLMWSQLVSHWLVVVLLSGQLFSLSMWRYSNQEFVSLSPRLALVTTVSEACRGFCSVFGVACVWRVCVYCQVLSVTIKREHAHKYINKSFTLGYGTRILLFAESSPRAMDEHAEYWWDSETKD